VTIFEVFAAVASGRFSSREHVMADSSDTTSGQRKYRGRAGSARDWAGRYDGGDLPWDTGEPDRHLVEVVRAFPVPPGRALEVGCGTGTNAVWLASAGFAVHAVDIAATAIEAARERARKSGASVELETLDFLRDDLQAGPFDFIFDRGCLHVFDDVDDQVQFARRVARLLEPDGLWLSVSGSTEGPERDHGPPRRSARDLVQAIEPVLEIVELRTGAFHANVPTPARAWICLARKRRVPAQPSTRR
jgi:SAM-dependent methyltransferase